MHIKLKLLKRAVHSLTQHNRRARVGYRGGHRSQSSASGYAPSKAAVGWGNYTGVHMRNRTPSEVLDGKAPLDIREDAESLITCMRVESYTVVFKHVEARHRNGNLTPRGTKTYFV